MRRREFLEKGIKLSSIIAFSDLIVGCGGNDIFGGLEVTGYYINLNGKKAKLSKVLIPRTTREFYLKFSGDITTNPNHSPEELIDLYKGNNIISTYKDYDTTSMVLKVNEKLNYGTTYNIKIDGKISGDDFGEDATIEFFTTPVVLSSESARIGLTDSVSITVDGLFVAGKVINDYRIKAINAVDSNGSAITKRTINRVLDILLEDYTITFKSKNNKGDFLFEIIVSSGDKDYKGYFYIDVV